MNNEIVFKVIYNLNIQDDIKTIIYQFKIRSKYSKKDYKRCCTSFNFIN